MAQRRFEELEGHLGTLCTYSSEFGNRNPFYWKRQKKLFIFNSFLPVDSVANVLVCCDFS
jgi:acyl-CoA hydrolase